MIGRQDLKISCRRGLAAILAVWLSGLVFLICCPSSRAASAEAFCPLAKMGGHCDKARKDAAPSWNNENTDDCGVTGCAYLPIIFDKSRKLEKAQKQTASVPIVIQADFAPPAAPKIRSSPIVSYTRISLGNRVLAKNCILRI
jgi:hypothetical protein